MITDKRRRDLYLIVVKLLDVAARAGFVLAVTYALPISQAGQFGLLTTLVGLFAFGFNFERHIDIQRRSAGQPYEVFDRYVSSALGFFAFNWMLMVPLFIGAIILLAHVSPELIAFAVVIVIGEHLSNQAYFFALISPRYYPLLLLVAAKNVVLVGVVLYQALLSGTGLDLAFVLPLWAAGAVVCTAALAIMWLRIRTAAPREKSFHFGVDILGQHKASGVHFLLGLIALLLLQYDRLAVGALMPLDQVGLYFRHTMLVSLAYQMFNVVSFNRIMPAIFAAAHTQDVAHLRGRVMREYGKTLIGAPLLLGALWLADALTGGVYAERFHLSLLLIAIMLGGFVLRAAADFCGLILNALHGEREVLRYQTIAFAVGAVVLAVLTWRFGVYGAATALVFTSALYLALIATRVFRMSGKGLPA
ncbi:lipopolysaccharide biosynthesis protein [Brevundimonas sp.]